MNCEEYKDRGEDEYFALSRVVRNILEKIVKDSASELRCQPIQNRAKSPVSLKKKLEMRGLLDADNIEAELKDLAGCRFIFYTNSDANKLLNSRLITDCFDVDWEKSKIHEPIDDDDSRYVATHYTVRLHPDTLVQEGMDKFAGMLCEIQVQTILNHAWAETTHDIIYKSPSLEGYGTAEFQSIERRLNRVMTDYLRPAGYEFQKAQLDFENLVTGKSIYESGSLDQLNSCEDNNQRFELLERFHDYVLPNYDDIVSAYPKVRQQIVGVIKEARKTAAQPIATPFGNFPGKSDVEVSDIALDIMERLRYIDVEQSFVSLCEIYSTSSSEKETDRLVKAAENLAANNLAIWRTHGPVVQKKLVDQIKLLEPDLVMSVLPLVAAVLSQVLSSEAESIKSGAHAFTIQRAAILPSPELKALREEAIDIIVKLCTAASDSDRRLLINSAWSATRTTSYPPQNDDLDAIIIENSRILVDFFTGRVPGENFESLQSIEHKVYWLKRHFSPWAEEGHGHSARSAVAALLLQAIDNFRNAVNEDKEYFIYKVLVGYESVFPPAWDNDEFGYKEENEYRTNELSSLIASIDQDNAAAWKERIERCASVESRDLATFRYFGQFLSDVASAHPVIALDLVTDKSPAGVKFLPSLYFGLQQSMPAEVSEALFGWCRERFSIDRICRAMRFSHELDMNLLEASLDGAIETDDRIALLEVVATLVSHENVESADRQLALFRKCISYLTVNRDAAWVHEVWVRVRASRLLSELSAEDAKLVLNNMVHIPQLEYHAEAILRELLDRHPGLVVEYFGKRVRYERELDDKQGYSAIPYEFYEIAEKLQPHFASIVEMGQALFLEDGFLFEFRGGRLLSNVFPKFTPEFEALLIELVETGEEQKIDFVLHILRNYKGETFLHAVCKEIANALSPGDRLLNHLSIVLDSTGVVSGEFGMRNAYMAKKDELLPWLDDERERVRGFAVRVRLSLDRQIAAEQRRAREDMEMRKRDYEEVVGPEEQGGNATGENNKS